MDENFLSLFSARLKEERKRLRLKQDEAAGMCGVSREVWGRYERGLTVPGGDVLMRFAMANADVQYVLTGSRERPLELALAGDERELLALFRAASLTGKAAAIGALQGAVGGGGPKISVGGSFRGQVVEGGQVIRGELNIGQANRGKKR